MNFSVHVTPRAAVDEITGVGESGELRARTRAAPTDGRANEALRKLVAKELDIAPSRVTIERGHAARNKQVAIAEIAVDEVLRRWPGLRVR